MAAKEGGTARPYERDADGLRVDVRALSRERAKLSETQRELEHGLEKLEVQQRDTAEQLRSAQRFMIPKENRLKDVCSDVEVENAQRLLDKLPEEVWEKILDNLGENDLFPLALSCRSFRQKQKELVARAKQNGKPRPTLKTTLTRTFHLKHIVKLPASAEYIKFCMKEEEFLDDTENVRCLQCLALLHGHLPLLQDQDFLDPDDIIRGLWITAAAALGGQLETLQWLHQQGAILDQKLFFHIASVGGNLEMMRWLRSEDCPWDQSACWGAAGVGHLEALKWLRCEGCPWNEKSCAYAAQGGQLEILKWLRSEGCPWNEGICSPAAHGGHLEVLKWLRSQGCSWNELACYRAAAGGHLEVLKWLRSQGCPWGMQTCDTAAMSGHLDVLKWAIDNGCPYQVWPATQEAFAALGLA